MIHTAGRVTCCALMCLMGIMRARSEVVHSRVRFSLIDCRRLRHNLARLRVREELSAPLIF